MVAKYCKIYLIIFHIKNSYTKCNHHTFESKFSVLSTSDVSCDCNISIYTLYTPNGHFSFSLSMAEDFTRNLWHINDWSYRFSKKIASFPLLLHFFASFISYRNRKYKIVYYGKMYIIFKLFNCKEWKI